MKILTSLATVLILRYLQTKKIDKIGGILFVAPWLDLLPKAIKDEDSYNTAYSWIHTDINFDKIKSITNNINCIFSNDDYFVSLHQKEKFEDLLNAKTIVVNNKGHICAEDGVNQLLEIYDKTLEMLNKKEV